MNLLFASLAPVVVIIFYIYLKDKYEKEPKKLLLYNFLLGAIVSVLVATILYYGTDVFITLDNEFSIFHQFSKAFLVVAVIEEFSKYIIVRYFAQPNKEFNEPYDGIVYAVMVSMGFAATENIMYVIEGGYHVAVLRAFTAVPAHATFGILMGYFMGKAKFAKHPSKYNLLGLFLAVLFHGAYDFFLFVDFLPGVWVGAFVSLFLGIYLSGKAIKAHQKNSFFKI
ncbi:MAG: PrsW family glutamic-type intramembrane protease [Xanthomarina sp.]